MRRSTGSYTALCVERGTGDGPFVRGDLGPGLLAQIKGPHIVQLDLAGRGAAAKEDHAVVDRVVNGRGVVAGLGGGTLPGNDFVPGLGRCRAAEGSDAQQSQKAAWSQECSLAIGGRAGANLAMRFDLGYVGIAQGDVAEALSDPGEESNRKIRHR